MEKIFVVGHKNPDTDTIVSAMLMAEYLGEGYVPVMTGKPNSETEYVFSRFGVEFPEILSSAENLKIFLVDHNEETQMVDGAEVDNVVGVVDHHKVNFRNSKPIFLHFRPWGSTATVIYDLFRKDGRDIPERLKPLLLSAILSDTVILKSPTTTDMDRMVVEELSAELGINYQELGMEMFKAKSRISEKTAEEIITNDFKNFDMSGKKVGIGQIETPDIESVRPRYGEILEKMKEKKEAGSYHTIVLMVTDILKEGSELLVVSDDEERIGEMFNTQISGGVSGFLEGVMSRKKQVAPVLEEGFRE